MILDNMVSVKEGAEEGATINSGASIHDMSALMENMLVDYVSGMDDEARKDFMESTEFQALLQENGGFVGRKSVVRLNKVDDLSRRIQLAAFQKAMEDGDPNYKELKKLQAKRRKLKSKIFAKYSNRVKNDAIKAQRALIKINPRAFSAPLR